MGLLFLGIYIMLSLIFLVRKKEIFSISMIYLVLAPDVKIGSTYISAIYIMIIFFLFIFILGRKQKICIYKQNKGYLSLIIFNFLLYFIMTLIYNFNISFSGISNIIGFIKLPVLLILIINLFKEEMTQRQNYDKIFKTLMIINLVGVCLQFIFGYKIRGFFESMYLTDTYTYYGALANWAVYNRKFGFFASPMLLGVFCLMTVNYFLIRYSQEKKQNHLIFLLISFILGLTSLSKTFIIGIPICIIIYLIMILTFGGKRKIYIDKSNFVNKILKFLVMIVIFIFVFSKLFTYMKENTTMSYYLNMILNPAKALETRYDMDSEELLLGETYKVIKEHFIFGVGFEKIQNEFLGDSTYVLALHHGGTVSLISIIIFYLMNICKALKNKDIGKILFISIWIITGLAMPTLFNTLLVIPFYLFFYNGKEKIDYEDKEVFKKS